MVLEALTADPDAEVLLVPVLVLLGLDEPPELVVEEGEEPDGDGDVAEPDEVLVAPDGEEALPPGPAVMETGKKVISDAANVVVDKL